MQQVTDLLIPFQEHCACSKFQGFKGQLDKHFKDKSVLSH